MRDRADVFSVKDHALDDFLSRTAQLQGYDVTEGLSESGFVPRLRTIVEAAGAAESSRDVGNMAAQVSWFAYIFIAQYDGLERPRGFAPKSIIAEAVDGPYMTDAVRVSLWSEDDVFKVVSDSPLPVERFKHPEGIPASYVPARWVLENILELVVAEANTLVPFARVVGSEAQRQAAGRMPSE